MGRRCWSNPLLVRDPVARTPRSRHRSHGYLLRRKPVEAGFQLPVVVPDRIRRREQTRGCEDVRPLPIRCQTALPPETNPCSARACARSLITRNGKCRPASRRYPGDARRFATRTPHGGSNSRTPIGCHGENPDQLKSEPGLRDCFRNRPGPRVGNTPLLTPTMRHLMPDHQHWAASLSTEASLVHRGEYAKLEGCSE